MTLEDMEGWDELPHEIPFYRVKLLYQKAMKYLDKRSTEEREDLVLCAGVLVRDYFHEARCNWIEEAISNNHPILDFLPVDARHPKGLLDYLFTDIPERAKDLVDHPDYGNTSSLEAMESAIEVLNIDDYFEGATATELLAALAVREMRLSAIGYFEDAKLPKGLAHLESEFKMEFLFSGAINAAEILGRIGSREWRVRYESARKFLSESHAFLARQNIVLQATNEYLQLTQQERMSDHAKKAAAARHRETNQAKRDAIAEWVETGHKYSSAAAFARERCLHYSVTNITLANWIRGHQQNKA